MKFWIRRDREQYFLAGWIITCVIGGFVSTYWHFYDRIEVKKKITLNTAATKQTQKLKDTQFLAPKLRPGATRYYQMEKPMALPKVPELENNYDGN